jgi:hypothetical protein
MKIDTLRPAPAEHMGEGSSLFLTTNYRENQACLIITSLPLQYLLRVHITLPLPKTSTKVIYKRESTQSSMQDGMWNPNYLRILIYTVLLTCKERGKKRSPSKCAKPANKLISLKFKQPITVATPEGPRAQSVKKKRNKKKN